jgi:hypothetical protein
MNTIIFTTEALAEHDAEVRAATRLEIAAEIRNAVGPAVKHSKGSAGVFEFSPKGKETEFWGYGNASAYTSAVLEVLSMLNPEYDYNETATTFPRGRATARDFSEAIADFSIQEGH